MAELLNGLHGWRLYFAAFVFGLVAGLAQAPWNLSFVYLVSIPLLFHLHAKAQGKKQAAWIGWFAGFGYFALTLSWIVEPFLVDWGRHGWMAPFAIFFLSTGLALFWALAFALARRGSVFSFSIFWVAGEYLRSTILTGFPWALFAYGLVETPIIQMASLVGVHGVGLLMLLSVILLAQALQKKWRQAGIGAGILGLMLGFGLWQQTARSVERDKPFVVRVVQPNAAQSLKWLPEFASVFFDRQIELTARETVVKPDLVIWPEAAVTFLPSLRLDMMLKIAVAADGAFVLFGTFQLGEDSNIYSGSVLIDEVGNIRDDYNKHHLVPFGEYIPFKNLLAGTGIRGLADLSRGGITPGSGPKVIEVEDIPPFIPLICYEVIFPKYATVKGQRPEWLVQLTNDAWFGEVSGPYQHLAQARVRAIEQGLPLVRSANTGVSAVIDSKGKVIDSIPLGESGFIDVELPAAGKVTIYAKLGNWPVLLLMIFGVFQQIINAFTIRGMHKEKSG